MSDNEPYQTLTIPQFLIIFSLNLKVLYIVGIQNCLTCDMNVTPVRLCSVLIPSTDRRIVD